MKGLLLLFLILPLGLSLLFITTHESEAQQIKCKECKIELDKSSYNRVDFDFYVKDDPQRNDEQLRVFAFNEKLKYNLKYEEIKISKNIHDVINGTTIIRIYGGLTFETPADALNYYNGLQSIPKALNDTIVYAKIYLLENTNHYKNPRPDIVIDVIEIGDIEETRTPLEIIIEPVGLGNETRTT